MRLIAEHYDIGITEPTVLVHEDDCLAMGVREGDHVRITGRGSANAIASMSDTLVPRGTIMMTRGVFDACGAEVGEEVEAVAAPVPESVRAIRDKMDGLELSDEGVAQVVEDAVHDRLSRIEMSAWLTALHIRGMTSRETAAYATAMASTGSTLDFGDRRVFDFHSFGGVPGNKITPVVVSIVASEGLLIPKLSSRAISSACGTADFVEVICPVDLCSDDVRRITETVGGVSSWTGATDLAPAGDHFIRVQRPLGIDPKPQMLASIMAKKVAAGATDVLMDIPMGAETKVRSPEEAKAYARDLMDLGDRLGMRVECAITYADQPLGVAVGPALEARECIQVLENRPGHEDVADKACICAGMILEMAGMPDGAVRARDALASGRAMERFRAIVSAQGGRRLDNLGGHQAGTLLGRGGLAEGRLRQPHLEQGGGGCGQGSWRPGGQGRGAGAGEEARQEGLQGRRADDGVRGDRGQARGRRRDRGLGLPVRHRRDAAGQGQALQEGRRATP